MCSFEFEMNKVVKTKLTISDKYLSQLSNWARKQIICNCDDLLPILVRESAPLN